MDKYTKYIGYKCKNMLIHGNEMVFIDKVIEYSNKHIIVNAIIDDSSDFIEKYNNIKIFPTYKMIELMAQSLGCLQYINSAENSKTNNNIKMGFLLGSRKFDIFIPYIKTNEEIFIVSTLIVQSDEGFGVYDCIVYKGNIENKEIITKATISVLSPEENLIDKVKYE